eukprot:CAMPEP_0194760486 /NCGR_PEP_ID=MMETSP0323_2-20130528/13389_1 /TAXON_ID=2866 ORGANISM="Crypthecodinium cohnii, Strain Seligo" /NCGR_SAMPLE_ID=MMETSP0323_2 /ASSEMBLY_ACC=CAM_ASM_000346 /LENGTH=74 /DNA_ID=CAMNT_0039681781 /DNA_START=102 /DNA_END=326 /DNA_ORIENTATION=+
MSMNLTTNEHIRDWYLQRNPFSSACIGNYAHFLCRPYGSELDVTINEAGPRPRDPEQELPDDQKPDRNRALGEP